MRSLIAVVVAIHATQALAQTGSIDFQGPTAGGGAVTEGDIFVPGPASVISPSELGIGPSMFGTFELDALLLSFIVTENQVGSGTLVLACS